MPHRFSVGRHLHISSTDLCNTENIRKWMHDHSHSIEKDIGCWRHILEIRLLLRLSPGPGQPFCHMHADDWKTCCKSMYISCCNMWQYLQKGTTWGQISILSFVYDLNVLFFLFTMHFNCATVAGSVSEIYLHKVWNYEKCIVEKTTFKYLLPVKPQHFVFFRVFRPHGLPAQILSHKYVRKLWAQPGR